MPILPGKEPRQVEVLAKDKGNVDILLDIVSSKKYKHRDYRLMISYRNDINMKIIVTIHIYSLQLSQKLWRVPHID